MNLAIVGEWNNRVVLVLALEKAMATHSSVLAWRIPGTGEAGGLPSMGSHRVGHDWQTELNWVFLTKGLSHSDRMWSTGEGNGKPLQYSCLENTMNSMKRQKNRTLKEEPPRSVGAQYATGDQWRNNSRKNEGMEPKQKQHPVVDWTGDRSKVRCC